MILKLDRILNREIICHCLLKHQGYTVPFLKFTQQIKNKSHVGYSKASNVLKAFRLLDVLEECLICLCSRKRL